MNSVIRSELNNINEMVKDALNISHVLFAQDLVGYVISSCKPSFRLKPLIENFSGHYSNPFNDSAKNAINCILFYVHRKNRHSFCNLIETGATANSKYMKCIIKLQESYFSKGFALTNFLYFCVDIAIMSAAFLNTGMKEAPKVAVICIVNALNTYDRRKSFAYLDLVTEEFPCVCNSSLKEAVKRLEDDLESYLWPLKEISDVLRADGSSTVAVNPSSRENLELAPASLKELNQVHLSDESSGVSSEMEIRYIIDKNVVL